MGRWMQLPGWILLIFIPLFGMGKDPQTVPRAFHSSFIENKGQWPDQVRYRATLPYGDLYLENNCLTFSFLEEKSVHALLRYKFLKEQDRKLHPLTNTRVPAHSYKVRFLDANPTPQLLPSCPDPDYQNYYLGNDPAHWASHVLKYHEVLYDELYPGIDMQLVQEQGRLKYNFLVGPASDPGMIRLKYEGVNSIRIRDGKCVIKTSVNTVEELAPIAWQTDDKGNKTLIPCRFALKGEVLTFQFPEGFDKVKELFIDPVLVFSTYSGSPVDNWGYTATYDKDGFLYAGGSSFMQGYPTVSGSFQVNYGGGSSDIVISKYDTTGAFMIFSTYMGGSGTEVPNSLVVNDNNELLVLGVTGSANFPVTSQAYDITFNGGTAYTLTYILQYPSGSDMIISRFSQDGTSLLASTFYGGSGNDGLNTFSPLRHNYADDARGEIKVDDNQFVYVCSSTQSSNLPVSPGAYQSTFGGDQDACVVKFDPTLSNIVWATYLGGSDADAGYSLVIEEDNSVYLAGGTTSSDFPVTAGALQPGFQGGGADGYISCLKNNGSSLYASTYYGSSTYDQIYFVDQDKMGNMLVCGQTNAPGLTFISNVSWSLPGGGQFISKIHPNLAGLIWSTAFGSGGGGPDISPTAFMVDVCDYVYVSGWGSAALSGFGGTSGLPVTANAFQSTTDDNDYYFMVMEADASGLIYATFFGGTANEHVDGGTSRFDKKGRIYQSVCAGCGGYDDFPTTPGAWSNINGSSNCNNGVIKYDFNINLAIADLHRPPSGCAPYTVNFQNTSFSNNLTTSHFQWNFGDGNYSIQFNPTHTFNLPGTYLVSLIISDTSSCNFADTTYQTIIVLGHNTVTLPTKNICLGENVQIGTPPLPDPTLYYIWTPAATLSNAGISNPVATPSSSTTYQLLISNGVCADTFAQHVRVYDFTVDAGNDTVVCVNTLLLNATASEDSLLFQWSSNPLFTDTLNNNLADPSVLVNISNQDNWFYIRTFNDYCEAFDSIKISFSIMVSPGNGQNPQCPDSCDGVAIILASGGIPPYQYLWSNGMTNDTIYNLCAGTYFVTVTDSVNCISVNGVNLTDPPDLVLTPEVTDVPCTEQCIGAIDLSVTGGTFPYQYLWNNGVQTASLSGLCSGTYLVTVTDDHQCPSFGQYTVDIDPILVNIEAEASPDTLFQGQSTQLSATMISNCSYSWSPSGSLNNPGISNPTATPWVTTTYLVTITDQYGCEAIDSVKITVKEVICREPYIYVANAFTPNQDQKNDIILVQSNYIETLSFRIFDRWGNKVFETGDQKQSWDGTWKGNPCEAGVYVYYLEAGCYNKEKFKTKGNITLIR